MSAVTELQPGAIFAGGYRIERPLSSGGMGSVYVATQLGTERPRALKLMHPDLVRDESLRRRFQQEARVGGRIDSDHVVEVVDAGIDAASGIPWLAMELLEGQSIHDAVVAQGSLPHTDLVEIFAQLAHALMAAHAVGVVHRDLKPENVFLAKARRQGSPFLVKVLDFGIAKVVAEHHTRTTSAVGTPLWMAPEQTSPTATIGPAADIWPLGLIAFFALTGRHYWLGANHEAPSQMMLLREVAFDPLVPASARAAVLGCADRLPAGFDAWFGRCVVRETPSRFASAAELHAALVPLLSGEPSLPYAPTLVALALAPTELPSATAPALAHTLAPPRRRRAGMIATLVGAAGFAAMVAVGGAIGWRVLQKMRIVEPAAQRGDDDEDTRRLRLDALTIVGNLPSGVVRPVLKQARPKLLACYDAALARHPQLHGQVSVDFVIGSGGAVTSAEGAGNVADPEVIGCVKDVILTLRFPAPPDKPVKVTQAMTFAPDAAPAPSGTPKQVSPRSPSSQIFTPRPADGD